MFGEIDKEVGEQFLTSVQDIATELDLRRLCHKILLNVGRLTDADRGSLFLVECFEDWNDTYESQNLYLQPKLFDVTVDSDFESVVLKAEEDALPIQFGYGIAGHVAQTKTGLRIVDAYEDSRFLPEMDLKTGYKTRSIICLPILDHLGQVVGVAQLVNKKSPDARFTELDENIFRRYLGFAGIGIQNARLFARVHEEQQQNQVLLRLAGAIFEEQTSLEKVVKTMMSHACECLRCYRTALYVLAPTQMHHGHGDEFRVKLCFEYLYNENQDAGGGGYSIQLLQGAQLNELPFTNLARYVAKHRQMLRINSVSEHNQGRGELPLLLRAVPIEIKQFLSLAIYNGQSTVVAVVQLLNKVDGKPFTSKNKAAVEAFGLFCGLAIHNAQTYEDVCKLSAKQKVALECLSYHARVPEEDVDQLQNETIPSSDYFQLSKYDFIDFALTDLDTCKATIRMFMECDLINKFRIPYGVLCRWVLNVKKNYRPVKYHNWRHALNVAQTMFSLLTTGKMDHFMTDLDILSLLVACLSHDLDHRGTNNSFQSKVMSPLAIIYSTSTMEHHHLDECIMILSDDSSNILQSLSTEDYKEAMHLIEHAILSTDLAIYFQKKNRFITMVEKGEFNWQEEDQKALLCGMMMTSCDVSAIAKPWEIQHRVAKLVAEEFFEQGDLEKLQLNQQPIAMMDRDQQDNLPSMQIGFIDSICLPLYKALSESFPWVKPIYDSCLENRNQWKKLADLVNMGLTWIDHDFIDKPVEHFCEKDIKKLPLVVTESRFADRTDTHNDQHSRYKETKRNIKLSELGNPQRTSSPSSFREKNGRKLSLNRVRSFSFDSDVSGLKPLMLREYHHHSKMCCIS